MTVFFLFLLAVGAGLGWWIVQRSARLRHESEQREAQLLEAVFAARRAGIGNGGETIDVERIFGGTEAGGRSKTSAEAVLRAAGLGPETMERVRSPPPRQASPAEAGVGFAAADTASPRPAASARPRSAAGGRENSAADITGAAEPAVPVRDLVQVFYEARGYRAEPAGPAARPIDCVLRHAADARRGYAFVSLPDSVSEAAVRAMLEQARRIGQSRVLVATEGSLAAEAASALRRQAAHVFDRTAIEAQLGMLDFAAAAKIRTVAGRRAMARTQQTAAG
jgi:hypothetical protein